MLMLYNLHDPRLLCEVEGLDMKTSYGGHFNRYEQPE